MATPTQLAQTTSEEQDAATRKAREIAAMLSKTLTGGAARPDGGKNVMLIPSDKVGMVIGKAGSRIKEIESTAGVNLQLESSGEPTRKIWISGTDDGVALAKKKIKDILDNANFGGRANQAPVKIIPIPSEKVGLVIGTGGSTIKRISQENSCHLKIVNEDEAVRTGQQVPPYGCQNLHIMGSAEAAAGAERAVMALISSIGVGGYGAHQPQQYQHRMQPYAAYSPAGYAQIIQAYANPAQPHMNAGYGYPQPSYVYPPQGYGAPLAGFQQYAVAAQYPQPVDGVKPGQMNYPTTQAVASNIGMHHPSLTGNQMSSSGDQVNNVQKTPIHNQSRIMQSPLINSGGQLPSNSLGAVGSMPLPAEPYSSVPGHTYPGYSHPETSHPAPPGNQQANEQTKSSKNDYNPALAGGNMPVKYHSSNEKHQAGDAQPQTYNPAINCSQQQGLGGNTSGNFKYPVGNHLMNPQRVGGINQSRYNPAMNGRYTNQPTQKTPQSAVSEDVSHSNVSNLTNT